MKTSFRNEGKMKIKIKRTYYNNPELKEMLGEVLQACGNMDLQEGIQNTSNCLKLAMIK